MEKGYRMEFFEGCSGFVYAFMGSCWEVEFVRRSFFRKLVEKLVRELRIVSVSVFAGA